MYTLSMLRASLYLLISFLFEYTYSLSSSYDYYFFSLRHVKGICIERLCKYKPKIEWTIHGLWPNKFNNEHPAFCNRTKVDFSSFPKNLIDSIESNWKNLYHNNTSSFLQNQWMKHGSCISFERYNVPKGNEQLFFYNKVIELFYLYTPENYYYNTDENDFIDPYKLREAILERFGSEFYMSCKTDKATGKKYVVKLRVPLDKEFNLIKEFKQEKSNCF